MPKQVRFSFLKVTRRLENNNGHIRKKNKNHSNSYLISSLRNCALLFFLTIALSSNLYSQPLIISPEKPVIDENTNDERITLTLDLSPEIKEELTGNGALKVDFYFLDNRLTNETSPSDCYIEYNNKVTVPLAIVLKVHPDSPIEPGDFFYYKVRFLINSLGISRDIQVCVRGAYYRTVYEYINEYSNHDGTVRYWLETDRMQNLVRYKVPESAFIAWYPIINDPWDIAAAYQLDLPLDYLSGWENSVIFSYGAYWLKERGWNSNRERDSLLSAYQNDVVPLNNNFIFSLGEKVPTNYFLEQLPSFEGKGLTTGQIDYAIAGRYNKELGTAEMNRLELNAESIFTELDEVYGTTDFMMIEPKIIGQMGKLISNPLSDAEKPLAVYILGSSVSEGTFSDGVIISHLARTHRILVGQISTTSKLINLLNYITNTFNSKIDILVLADHGNQYGLSFLGINTNAFMNIAKTLHNDATIFLSACSTAGFLPGQKSFAYALSDAIPGRTVIAAKNLTSGQLLRYFPNSTNSLRRYKAFMLNTSVAVIEDGIDYNNCSPATGTDVQTSCGPYAWIDGNTYNEDNNTATYTLTNSAGCDSIVTLDLTIIPIDNSIIIQDTIITAVQENANYQWLDCEDNLIIAGENSQYFIPDRSGNFAVEISQFNCIDTSECINYILTGNEKFINTYEISVFPNPTGGIINVRFQKLLNDVIIRCYDSTGRFLESKEYIYTNQISYEIKGASGYYLIEIIANNKKSLFEILKK